MGPQHDVNFDLNEDEEMLKALAERFVSSRYDLERRRAYQAHPAGYSPDNWALLAELGLLAATFEPDNGGLGIDAAGIAILFEALGRGLVVEPLIESVLVAAKLFERLASQGQKAAWLPGLMAGERRLALAHREAGARRNMAWVETRVETNGNGVHLAGVKSLVPAGAGADAYLVSARHDGKPGDRDGASLYLVESTAPGLAVHPVRMIDGSVAVTLTLRDVAVDARHVMGGGIADILAVERLASIARSAEALGIMERLFAETLDYLRTRRQFGVALGGFQALQHRMVAQYSMIEQARAWLNLAVLAGETSGEGDPVDGARAFISAASLALGHEMIQMHGGMGVSDELGIGHGHKRLMFLSRWPDDAEDALDRYAGIDTGR